MQGDFTRASAFVATANTTPNENKEMKTADRNMQQLIDNNALCFRGLSLLFATQAVAATANVVIARDDTKVIAKFTGKARIRIKNPVSVAASGESMVAKVRVNGSVPSQKGATINSTIAANTWVASDYEVKVVEGDTITANMTYTAGGGPTPLVNTNIEVDIIPTPA